MSVYRRSAGEATLDDPATLDDYATAGKYVAARVAAAYNVKKG